MHAPIILEERACYVILLHARGSRHAYNVWLDRFSLSFSPLSFPFLSFPFLSFPFLWFLSFPFRSILLIFSSFCYVLLCSALVCSVIWLLSCPALFWFSWYSGVLSSFSLQHISDVWGWIEALLLTLRDLGESCSTKSKVSPIKI